MTRTRQYTLATMRRGLTLIELLVVILILAVLIAILIPAITGAMQKAQEGAVTAEMVQMKQALASFKDRFGDYPPSRILLDETGNYYQYSASTASIGNTPGGVPGPTDLTAGELSERSLRYLQKFFPRMQFLGPGDGQGGYHYDFNGNNINDGPYILQGYDCLVFFLGGIPSQSKDSNGNTQWSMTGLGKSPTNPFPYLGNNATPQQIANILSNRDAPFFEFHADRLVDFDGNGLPGYVDSLGIANNARYYVYFSAYGNNGYDPNDNNVGPGSPDLTDDNIAYAGGPLFRNYMCSFGLISNTNATPSLITSQAPNPYTTTQPVPLNANSGSPSGVPAGFVNPNTYQIFSAGRDRLYGIGGQFAGQSGTASRIPFDPAISPPDVAIRVRENDNLGDWTTGRLQ